MYKDNYIKSLRKEVTELVENYLSPVSMEYGYSDVPLETSIKWRPLVLLLGNYSSGKSTLINEFLGIKVQNTGQAPTDDSFTIITNDDKIKPDENIRITEERDGKVLLNDPEYPFENLKKHGQKFASHFKLKKVNSPFLENIALIDTPGMLDSISEHDRGYNYQEVIGDIAQMADLVLVFFDPHKAGTVREAHISLRETLPSRTFEDRVHFVLNRIDECASMIDFVRVYGTLCWNLSQITGRKDIPIVHFTYSKIAFEARTDVSKEDLSYLQYLENEREELKNVIATTPQYHLDKLATFIEHHSERLFHFLETLKNYRQKMNRYGFKTGSFGLFTGLLAGGITSFVMYSQGLYNQDIIAGTGVITAIVLFFIWMILPNRLLLKKHHKKLLDSFDDITKLNNQTRKDSWLSIKDLAYKYIEKKSGKFAISKVSSQLSRVKYVCDHGSKDIREGINELATIKPDEKNPETDKNNPIINEENSN